MLWKWQFCKKIYCKKIINDSQHMFYWQEKLLLKRQKQGSCVFPLHGTSVFIIFTGQFCCVHVFNGLSDMLSNVFKVSVISALCIPSSSLKVTLLSCTLPSFSWGQHEKDSWTADSSKLNYTGEGFRVSHILIMIRLSMFCPTNNYEPFVRKFGIFFCHQLATMIC